MSTYRTSRTRTVSKIALVAAAASLLAACSSEVERLSDYPPVNTTSSVASTERTARTAPVERVASRRLDNAPATATPSWSRPSYTPPVTRTAYRAPAPASTAGYVTVRRGQTLYSIARANGLSVRQLAAANGISYPYELKVGQRLRIPGVANPVSPEPTVPIRAADTGTPQAQPVRADAEERNFGASKPTVHRVAPGETLFSLGRKYGVNPYRIAAYNGLPRDVQLKVGQVVRIPATSGWRMTQPGTSLKKSTRTVRKPSTERQPRKDTERIVQSDPVPPAPSVNRETQARPELANGFRWPVRGRVISTFGEKPNGVRNEGINIAVPEGADVHAASDGVVAYAGNELKGYGNLVLIRHRNGWVTAYAHNKELFVKRGDRVRRGQVIAKAGSTGSVKTPQLHFELRKGASAVDPLKYLGTATAMN